MSAKRSGSSSFSEAAIALEGQVVRHLRVLLEEPEHLAHVLLELGGVGRALLGAARTTTAM